MIPLGAFVPALVTLLVTVGPLDTAALFAVLTARVSVPERRRIAVRAVAIATVVLAGFAVGGAALFKLLGIGMPAFRLAGGFLLLLVSVDLVFAKPTGLSSITTAEAREAEEPHDITVFPLAIPLIAGPGSLTALVLLMGPPPWAHSTDIAVLAALAVVMAATLVSLLLAGQLVRVLRLTGVNVVARVSGVVLAALAMQFMLDGLHLSGVFAGLR